MCSLWSAKQTLVDLSTDLSAQASNLLSQTTSSCQLQLFKKGRKQTDVTIATVSYPHLGYPAHQVFYAQNEHMHDRWTCVL